MAGKNWTEEELSTFCLEFALLLKAGISVGEGFLILSENEVELKKKELFRSLYEKTTHRASVSQTMENAKVFPPYMLKLIRIGEETGYLEECFTALSRYYDQRVRTARLLKETVMFPLILFLMMSVVAIVLITEVLPIFQSVFGQLGGTLPVGALFFLNIGTSLKKGRFLFLGIFLGLTFLGVFMAYMPILQNKWNSFVQYIYSKSKIGKLSAQAEFASVLSMTISSGLDPSRSLELAEEFCSYTFFRHGIGRCSEKLRLGTGFVKALEEEGLFGSMYCRMLAIGVKSGNLDEILKEISDRTEEDAAAALTRAAAIVEPTVVIGLSVMVGFLLLSVMFPLVGIMSSLG